MEPYQLKYIENCRRIARLNDIYSVEVGDYDCWYKELSGNLKEAEALREENNEILNKHLFVMLDDLFSASDEDIVNLEKFADELMDGSNNLDVGIYVLIHDSLLSLYRNRKNRNKVIEELYKLGMGLYYRNRIVQGISRKWTESFWYTNELVFTEAGSYIRYFSEIDDEETKGYIIRSLANVSLTTDDRGRKIDITSRDIRYFNSSSLFLVDIVCTISL